MAGEHVDIPVIVNGKEYRTGDTAPVVMPHAHQHVLGTWHKATPELVQQAIAATTAARADWSRWAWEDRAAVFLRAAELLSTTWRDTINAATMLGQSKTAFQSEIDAACELIDFFRFNCAYARGPVRRAADQRQGRLEPDRLPPARGLRLRGQPVQLHGDRRQPVGRAGADGQHGDLEAGADGDAERLLRDEAAGGGGPAARRDQLRARRSGADLRRAAVARRPRRRALHRQHDGVQQHVEDDRRPNGRVPLVSAHRRRDRRQGLHHGARVGRRRRARGRDRAWRLRVPGAEVLGVQPRVHPADRCGPACAIGWSR